MIPKLLNKVIFGCENSVDNVTGWTLCALSENVCPDIGYAQTKFYEKVQLQKIEGIRGSRAFVWSEPIVLGGDLPKSPKAILHNLPLHTWYYFKLFTT